MSRGLTNLFYRMEQTIQLFPVAESWHIQALLRKAEVPANVTWIRRQSFRLNYEPEVESILRGAFDAVASFFCGTIFSEWFRDLMAVKWIGAMLPFIRLLGIDFLRSNIAAPVFDWLPSSISDTVGIIYRPSFFVERFETIWHRTVLVICR